MCKVILLVGVNTLAYSWSNQYNIGCGHAISSGKATFLDLNSFPMELNLGSVFSDVECYATELIGREILKLKVDVQGATPFLSQVRFSLFRSRCLA